MPTTIESAVFLKRFREFSSRNGNQRYEDDKHKIGKILTVIDAAFSDPEQRKATKDLVQSMFYQDSPMPYGMSEEELFVKSFGLQLWETPKGSNVAANYKPINPYDKVN